MKTHELKDGVITYYYNFRLSQYGNQFYDENGTELSNWSTQAGRFVLLKEEIQGDTASMDFVIIPNDGAEEQRFTKTFPIDEYNRFCQSILSGLIPPNALEVEG